MVVIDLKYIAYSWNYALQRSEEYHTIPDISQKMHSSTLKQLVEYRLVNRKMYGEIPPRVEYSLTDTGKELMPAVQMMIDSAQEHFKAIME